jgi:tRNA dimethylallyltransferase
MTKQLVTVIGPTAIGKTSVSIDLARHFDCPVISNDSRQFYKEMTIGTAVPSPDELASATHFFIQDRSIHQALNVGAYEKEALNLLTELFQTRDRVVMVGGSGLYLRAILVGLDHFPEIEPEYRKALNQQLESEGIAALQEELRRLDPISYDNLDLNNPHRVIRALEVCRSTGEPFSSFKNQPKVTRNFQAVKIGLRAPRALLYDRINKRVDQMMAQGLLEEVRSLYPYRESAALQTVGYQELFRYFEGKCSLDEAVDEIKKNTRRYAKRQITWNNKETDITWFDHPFDLKAILNSIPGLT